MYCINYYLPRSLCFFGTSVHFASEACTRLSSAQPVCCRPGRPRAPGTASRSPGHCGSPAGEAGAFLAGPSTPLAQESDRKGEVPGGWEGEACEPTGSVACADWNSEGKGAPGPGKAVVSRHGSVRAGGHCGHGHHLQALAGLGALLTWEGMPPSPHPCSSPSPGEPRGFLTWVGSSHLGQEEG